METVLYLGHTESDGSLSRTSLEALAAARALAGALDAEFLAALFGENAGTVARRVGGCGAARFLKAEGTELAQARYASDAAAAEALVRAAKATLIIAAHTSRMARILPGVAVRLNGRVDTHVNGIEVREGAPVAARWFYRQRIEGSVTRTQRPWFLLVDAGPAGAWRGAEAEVAWENIAQSAAPTRTENLGMHEPPVAEQTIRPEAELLFVAGAGWTRKQQDGQPHVEEAEQLILDFLRESRASLGSTKSLTDVAGEGQAVLHCLSHLNQVGQTGSTPRHAKGLSTCCHGEEPHVVGWRFVRERRAVNLDANCGWARGKADVLYVADAFEVMRHLNGMLKAGR